MDARLVWDTWRRILTNDQLVAWVVHPGDSDAGEPTGLSAGESEVLADYAGTPVATDTNVGMYRRGLVRNALAALSFVPPTRSLVFASGLDVEAVAAALFIGYGDGAPSIRHTTSIGEE